MKTRIILLFASIVCAAALAAGCSNPDEKSALQGDKLIKAGKHPEALKIFNPLARKKNLDESAANVVQIQFCLYYGNAEKRKKIKTLSEKDYRDIADSCAKFYENFPIRTDTGLGPFQVGLLYKNMGEPELAIKMFKLAEEKHFYKASGAKRTLKYQKPCLALYKNLYDCYEAIGGETGEAGKTKAMLDQRKFCIPDKKPEAKKMY